MGLLLWGSLSPNITGTRAFASALADIIIIATTIPLMVMCAIVPGLAIASGVYLAKRPKATNGRLQVLFWRIDALVTKLQGKTDSTLPQLARPVITGHAIAAFLSELWKQSLKQIKSIISRS
jgi:hypothetical protein